MTPDPHSPSQDASADDPRRWLSALVDGDPQALDQGCARWRDDDDARRAWHTYHLIGDVMRSEELATEPARDAAFLAALRTRLAAEPVVFAPAPVAVPRRRQAWLLPAAVAAGFVFVSGVLVVARVGQPGVARDGAALASASSPPALAVLPMQAPVRLVGDVIRDPRLDEFLRAHQAASGGVAVAAPGGMLRRVDIEVTTSSGR